MSCLDQRHAGRAGADAGKDSLNKRAMKSDSDVIDAWHCGQPCKGGWCHSLRVRICCRYSRSRACWRFTADSCGACGRSGRGIVPSAGAPSGPCHYLSNPRRRPSGILPPKACLAQRHARWCCHEDRLTRSNVSARRPSSARSDTARGGTRYSSAAGLDSPCPGPRRISTGV